MKCLYYSVFFVSRGSQCDQAAHGGIGPNWECAAESASTAALIYLHCSAPAPPISRSWLPPLPLSLFLSLTVCPGVCGNAAFRRERAGGLSAITRFCKNAYAYVKDQKTGGEREGESEEVRGRKREREGGGMLKVKSPRDLEELGASKTEFCNVTKKGKKEQREVLHGELAIFSV